MAFLNKNNNFFFAKKTNQACQDIQKHDMSTILNILGPFLQERSYKKLGAEPFARAAVADWDEFVSTKFSDMVISMTQHELRRY